MPARMSGLAEGSAILKITASRDICSDARHLVEPRLDRGEAVDGRQQIGQIAPKAITNSAMACVSPSIAIATGMIAETGSGRKNSSVGAT